MIRKIGNGSFGEVFEAKLIIRSGSGDLQYNVAIKKLNDENTNTNELLKEAIMLQNCNHFNFVKFYGICLKMHKIHYLIMEFMNKGDLHTYLKTIKTKLDICEIISISLQIADACEYLEVNKICHRDLAARNCLLSLNSSSKLIVKVADFGLARNLDSDNIYMLKCTNRLPIRWMAPESIVDGDYTKESDVWSFGILLFEIVSLGALPYEGMSNYQVNEHVKKGGIQKISLDLPKEM